MASFQRFTILTFAAIFCLHRIAEGAYNNEEDAQALLAFKAQLHDPNFALQSWSVLTTPCSSWRGLKCSRRGRVVGLNLKDAGLQGTISGELLGNLEALDLTGNDDLEGTISSHNCKRFMVPSSVSCTKRNFSSPRRSLLTTTTKSRKRSAGVRWGLGIAVGIVSGAVAATLLALLTRAVLGCYAGTEDLKKPIIFNKKISPQMLAFLDKEDALTDCRVLGEGGNGKVYQVSLQEDFVVAIKCVRHHSEPEQEQEEGDPISHDAKQIRAELETLGFIRHRNLVQLLAYIFKSDSHLLVYEFMPGGSLQDALNRMAKGTLTLSWPERHRILCGVAQGLAYLHNESLGSSIVHRDLKPANILLDEGYEAKLGDFGLAAIVPLKATHATTDVLAGTIGFIAPEYHQTMRYSQKSDVFSYGVVIAQLVTVRSPTEQFIVENGGSIGQWLQKCLQSGNPVEAIDPALIGSGYEAEILLAMKIAVFCTNLDPLQRPKSSEVLKMLLQIRNPDPVPTDTLDVHSTGSDTPILGSSGPLGFVQSTSNTQSSSF
uniref:Leucine-rich repeat receptor-like protein kinase n=1 Tax=Pohlia nutans TaxID=140635 RepID=A0A1P8DYW9_9BRYO|nr:leucine-rich repeat receptor-like protein kinase [Pohlia nutans]